LSAAARPAPWSGFTGPASQRLGFTRGWLWFAVAAAAAVATTVAIPLAAPLRFAYPAPSLHVALETGTALIGLVATMIVIRGWRDGPRLDRLIVGAGLAVIAATYAALAVMVAISPGDGPRGLVGLTGILSGSLLVCAGAFAPARRLVRPAAAAAAMVLVVLVTLAAAIVPVELVLDEWRGQQRPADADLTRTLLSQPLVAVALQMTMALSLAAASVGLTGRGIRTEDAFARRLGLACLFFAFSMLHYVLLPPVTHEWVHLGDVLRLLFCVVLLWAAVVEVAGAVAARAAARERRRIARDLHDGVAQELAFIRRRAVRLAGQVDAEDIVVAAERALQDSRWAIEHLARAPDEPLERVLARHAAAIAARTGVAVTFVTKGTTEHVGPEVSEALARILGEAVTNARHGNAKLVHVELSTHPLRLRVIDDGTGFDTTANGTGYGLGGMRERAALVGAELIVRSGPGAGTEVAVELR
jgi:signal transduction histidine kinase